MVMQFALYSVAKDPDSHCWLSMKLSKGAHWSGEYLILLERRFKNLEGSS